MSLNWNSYVADGALNQSDKEWPDISTPTTARPILATAPASNNHSPQSNMTDSEHTSPYNGIGTSDAYFTDAFYNPDENFLRDLDILQPFGDAFAEQSTTSESSPEPLATANLFDQTLFTAPLQGAVSRGSRSLKRSSQPTAVPQRKISVSSTSSQRSRISMHNEPSFATKNGFPENLIFSNSPSRSPQTYEPEVDAARESITVSKEPGSTSKRIRQKQPDTLSACWTSPLCPNHTKDGSPPDPTTCGGACAPFLFAPADGLTSPITLDQAILRHEIDLTKDSPQSPISPLGMARGIKRSESDSSTAPSGRVLPKNSGKARTASASVKREPAASRHARTNDDDDDSTSPDAHTDLPDIHAAARRRQPHNQVERKYRESLNTQLESLRRVVPSLQPSADEAAQASGSGCADIEDLPAARKPSKAVVLASATAYIRQMEKERRQLVDENQVLRSRIKALQALVKCEDCSLMQYVMNMNIQTAS